MLFEKSTVHFEITTVCNHRCIFCYNQYQVFDANKNQEYISFDKYKKIINKLVEMKVDHVILTGGEPFLHPEIKKIIDYAKSKNFSLSINTNATLLTPEINEFLATKRISLLVSMHGTDNLFNKLVGMKTFDKVKKNIINARNEYDLKITLQFVPLKENYKQLDKVAEFGKKVGCYVQVGRYTDPCGTGENYPEMGLSQQEYHALFKNIIKIKKELQIPIGLGNGIPFCMIDEESISNDILNLFNRCGCSLGRSIWTLNPNGDIRGCPQLNVNIGNILTNTLDELTLELDKRYNSQLIVPTICQNCEIQILCSGGCRASGFVRSGSINSYDPLFPQDEIKRNLSIKLIEQKIKIIAGAKKEKLEKKLNGKEILKYNKDLNGRIQGEIYYIRGFGSKGFIYKELNETATAILKKFNHPMQISIAIQELADEFSTNPKEIKQDVFECVEDLITSDILQFSK
ncbi:PqqD family peptide modification chaperone [Candidatus Lokiarchaeum ossiferum]|uniref:PqqD family peptide modification chaperone n=1 Tax=Candidatus Lokiarchaeum ossiferum TaxID=2951803 RepID=UPI00352F135A